MHPGGPPIYGTARCGAQPGRCDLPAIRALADRQGRARSALQPFFVFDSEHLFFRFKNKGFQLDDEYGVLIGTIFGHTAASKKALHDLYFVNYY
jgi:hypothetical protein